MLETGSIGKRTHRYLYFIAFVAVPTQLRARGMAVAGFVRLGSSLFLAQIFPPMVESFQTRFGSEAGVFGLYAGICVVAFVFTFLMVPETKGKTLEEISSFYVTGG